MINERKLSKSELKKREDIIMKMKGNKRDLVKKYGKDAEAVMYGRATNMAKKKTENMRDPKITELIKDALKNPKKADLDKDGKLSDYEKTRGAAIEKAMAKEDYDGGDLESGQYGDPKVGNYDITSQSDNEASDIEALAAAGLEEDIDIGHEDNEPGMLQGDLYEIGKAAMEIYAMLDDMEGEGEVDLPSWWQSKVFKAKEAIVGAAEYLDFELKEPAIDAVVDKVAPLDINVDPLGETVEDYITSVDDLTEVEIPSSLLTKIAAEVKSPKTLASMMVNLYNAVQDKEAQDYSKNQKFGRALSFLKDLADDEEEVADEKVDEMSNADSNYGSNEGSNENSNDNPESYSGLKKFVAEKLAKDLKEGLPKGFFDKAMKAKDEIDEVGKGYFKKKFGIGKKGFSMDDRKEIDETIEEAYNKIQEGAYPFDQCVADNEGKYGEEGAKRVCGAIRAAYGEGLVKEDYDSLVGKLKKQGKSAKAAKAIAGAMASYKAKGGGKGPTAKQAKRAK